MRQYLSVFILKNIMHLQVELTYRVEVIFLLLNTTVLVASTVILYVLVFSQVRAVGDWDLRAILYLFAFGNIAISVYTMFSWGPIYHQFRPAVKDGTLDFFLLKPMSPWFLLSTGRFDMSGFARFIPSFGLLLYLLVRFPISVGVVYFLAAGIIAVIGLILLHTMFFLLYSLGFWTTSTDSFHHLGWTFASAVASPITVYPKGVFWALSTVVPIAFAGVIPTRIITGLEPLSALTLVKIAVVTGGFLFACAVVWKAGLRRYSGASA